jgi:(p)ppGpp synthase/HD superfamily hydrolase
LTLVEQAREFAIKAHGDQKYSAQPYSVHLERVVSVLHRFDITDTRIIAAAWLHDVLEDVPEVRYLDLRNRFDVRVADLVWCVTDELGPYRNERKAKTYPKIAADHDAVILKLADRIANVEAAYADGSNFLDMYREEHVGFMLALYQKENVAAQPMWDRLGELLVGQVRAFAI